VHRFLVEARAVGLTGQKNSRMIYYAHYTPYLLHNHVYIVFIYA
jgi:hypothetical protein